MDISGTQTEFSSSGTVIFNAPGDEADIFVGVDNSFNVESQTTDVEVFAARTASFRAGNDITMNANNDITFFVTEEDIVGAASKQISFSYGDLLDVSVSSEIELKAGAITVGSSGNTEFISLQDILVEARALGGKYVHTEIEITDVDDIGSSSTSPSGFPWIRQVLISQPLRR